MYLKESTQIEQLLNKNKYPPGQMERFWKDVTAEMYRKHPNKVQPTIDSVRNKNPENARIMQEEYNRLRGL